jgi:hypothetical protein
MSGRPSRKGARSTPTRSVEAVQGGLAFLDAVAERQDLRAERRILVDQRSDPLLLMVAGSNVDLQRSDERPVGLRGQVDSFGERIVDLRYLRFLS